MYIAASCPSLDIRIKISGLLVGPSVIDPNEGSCITRCTFCWHILFPGLGQVEKTHQEIFSCIFIWWHRRKSCGEVWKQDSIEDLLLVSPYFLMTEDLMIEAPSSNNSKDRKGNLSYTFIRLLLILWVIFSYPYSWCTPVTKYFTWFFVHHLTTF